MFNVLTVTTLDSRNLGGLEILLRIGWQINSQFNKVCLKTFNTKLGSILFLKHLNDNIILVTKQRFVHESNLVPVYLNNQQSENTIDQASKYDRYSVNNHISTTNYVDLDGNSRNLEILERRSLMSFGHASFKSSEPSAANNLSLLGDGSNYNRTQRHTPNVVLEKVRTVRPIVLWR